MLEPFKKDSENYYVSRHSGPFSKHSGEQNFSQLLGSFTPLWTGFNKFGSVVKQWFMVESCGREKLLHKYPQCERQEAEEGAGVLPPLRTSPSLSKTSHRGPLLNGAGARDQALSTWAMEGHT